MDTFPPRGIALTLSWTGSSAGGGRRAVTLTPGAAARTAAALVLCAACYEAGLWSARLGRPAPGAGGAAVAAARPSPRAAAAVPASAVPGLEAPGQPAGQSADVITPLNVRDPAALVMAPDDAREPSLAPPAAPATPPEPGVRVIPRPGDAPPELKL